MRLHPLIEEAITSYGVNFGPSVCEAEWRKVLKPVSDALFKQEDKLLDCAWNAKKPNSN